MTSNKELEFKTKITKEKYEELLKVFELENNVFEQTNYYFDTPELKLKNNYIVLRIRQKGNTFKLTKKEHGDGKNEAYESHIFLQEEQALKMLQEGFNAEIIDLPYFVKPVCELTTERCKTTYKDGTIFFDKSVYYGNTDYEIEYEVDSFEQGTKDFNDFLNEFQITYEPTLRKSTRAYNCIFPKKD